MYNFPGFQIKPDILISNNRASELMREALTRYMLKAKDLSSLDMITDILEIRREKSPNSSAFINMNVADYTLLRYLREEKMTNIEPFTFLSYPANGIYGSIFGVPIYINPECRDRTALLISEDACFFVLKNPGLDKVSRHKFVEIYSMKESIGLFLKSRLKSLCRNDENFIGMMDRSFDVFIAKIMEKYSYV